MTIIISKLFDCCSPLDAIPTPSLRHGMKALFIVWPNAGPISVHQIHIGWYFFLCWIPEEISIKRQTMPQLFAVSWKPKRNSWSTTILIWILSSVCLFLCLCVICAPELSARKEFRLKINFRQVSSRSFSVEKSNRYSNKDFLFLICSLLLFYPCGFFMCIFSLLLLNNQ